MKKYVVLMFLSFLIPQFGSSQQFSCADSLSRNKATNVIEKHFADFITNNNYLLYSVADKWYLVIIESLDNYEEYYVCEDTLMECGKKGSVKIKKPNEILGKAFDKNLYHKGFINLNSDFYESGYELSEGNTTYFYFKDKDGTIYGESKLTAFVKPNPINETVYNYLLKRLLCYITATDCDKKSK